MPQMPLYQQQQRQQQPQVGPLLERASLNVMLLMRISHTEQQHVVAESTIA